MGSNGQSSRGWLVYVGVILVYIVFTGFIANAQAMLLEPVTSDLGISRTLFSTLMSVTGLVNMCVSMFYSQLIGKAGLRMIVVLGCCGGIGYCALFVVAGMVPAVAVVCIAAAQVLLGLTCSWAGLMSASILINNWFAKRSGLLIGIAVACGGLGGMVASPVVSWLILNFGWQTDVLVRCIVALAATVLVALLVKPAPADKSLMVWAGQNSEEDSIDKPTEETAETTGIAFVEAKKTRNFWFAVLTVFLISLCIYPSIMVMAAHATDIGFAAAAGLTMTVIYASNIIASTPMGGIIEKIGNRKVLTACLVLFVIGLALLASGPTSLPLLFVAAVVVGVNYTLLQVPVPLIAKEIFGLRDFPRIQSYLFTASVLGCTVSLPLYNVGFDLLGSYQPMFLATIPIVVVTLVCLFVCTSKVRMPK